MPIQGRQFIWAFFKLLLIAAVFAILFWLVGWLSAEWGFPELLTKVLRTFLIVAAAVVAIDALLGLADYNFITWCLLFVIVIGGCSKPHETTPFELEMREGHLKVEQSIKALENRVDTIETQCKIKKAA